MIRIVYKYISTHDNILHALRNVPPMERGCLVCCIRAFVGQVAGSLDGSPEVGRIGMYCGVCVCVPVA